MRTRHAHLRKRLNPVDRGNPVIDPAADRWQRRPQTIAHECDWLSGDTIAIRQDTVRHQEEPSGVTTEVAEVSANPPRHVTAWLSGAIGWTAAMAPHILHHAGLLFGAALVAGATGTLLFGAIAVIAMAPMLVRLHRRTDSWIAPAAMVALMVVMFSVSRLMMG